MSSFRSRYLAFLESRNRASEAAMGKTILGVADTADAIVADGKVPPDRLDVLVNGVGSKASLVWQNSAEMLQALASGGYDVAPAYMALARHPMGRVRFAALCALSRGMPRSVVDEMLVSGLKDKSANCRWKAAEMALEFHKRWLLPLMVDALARETSEKARGAIEYSVAYMRDGYQLKPLSGDRYSLWLQRRGGSVSISVTATDLAEKGVDAIVAELATKKLGIVGGEPPEPFEEVRIDESA